MHTAPGFSMVIRQLVSLEGLVKKYKRDMHELLLSKKRM